MAHAPDINVLTQALDLVGACPGLQSISVERYRQIFDENWSAEHDDAYYSGELAQAAIVYIMAAKAVQADPHYFDVVLSDEFAVANRWPWDSHWFKPSEVQERNLEKAGALIAAELDRVIRQRAWPAVQ